MTESEATKLVGMLVAAFPRGPWPAETRALYEAELQNVDAKHGGEAVLRAIRGCKYQPTIAELLELHHESARDERRLQRDKAEQRQITEQLNSQVRRLVAPIGNGGKGAS